MSFNLSHTSCPLRRHGCPAGRTACNRHISRDRPRKSENLMQNADIAFVSNSPRKHRQGLGNETVPWNVASSKSHFSLSLSLTLSLGAFLLHMLSNPPHPRLSLLVQVGLSQPGEQSNSFTKIFHESSKLLSNMKAFFLK